MRGFLIAMALVLAGCTTDKPPPAWVSISGQTPAVSLDTAKVICDGEAAKARAASSADHTISGDLNRYVDNQAVVKGCMAQQGWKLDGPGEARL